MNRDDIYALCKKIAPKYDYDPLMVLAQVEQESSYDETIPRLEQNYLRQYVLPDPKLKETSPAVKVLMASSFGLGQLLGHSLFALDFFVGMDSMSVAMQLDHYVCSFEDQIETMCKWLKYKQGLGNTHTLDDALRRYNGGGDPLYQQKVYTRYRKLKGIYG